MNVAPRLSGPMLASVADGRHQVKVTGPPAGVVACGGQELVSVDFLVPAGIVAPPITSSLGPRHGVRHRHGDRVDGDADVLGVLACRLVADGHTLVVPVFVGHAIHGEGPRHLPVVRREGARRRGDTDGPSSKRSSRREEVRRRP